MLDMQENIFILYFLSYCQNIKYASLSTAWPRGLKCRFYGDQVIAIAWSRFNSHSRHTRYRIHGSQWLSQLTDFEQAAN